VFIKKYLKANKQLLPSKSAYFRQFFLERTDNMAKYVNIYKTKRNHWFNWLHWYLSEDCPLPHSLSCEKILICLINCNLQARQAVTAW